MKYIDYYKVLGVERDASASDIKKAYRKLAHKYHPDISKGADSEERFKEVAEAYATLKDSEKRAAYDNLGSHPQGESFVPPHQWQENFHASGMDFSDLDLSDLMAAFAAAQEGGGARQARPRKGGDYEVPINITLEQIYQGAETDVHVNLPEVDAHGVMRRVPRTFRVRIPKGASDGQRLRLPGKGAPGTHGGPAGDLYVVMNVQPHRLYQLDGQDLYMDLPLSPWEAALGASVQIPTLGGPVEMTIPPGTVSGRKLRLAKRGLPGPGQTQGNQYAVVRIDIPKALTDAERTLFSQLADQSAFNPRAHFTTGG